MDNINKDILFEIRKYLSLKDLINLKCVNKDLNSKITITQKEIIIYQIDKILLILRNLMDYLKMK